MKRILLSCLVLALTFALFTGCTDRNGNVSTNDGGMVNGTNDVTPTTGNGTNGGSTNGGSNGTNGGSTNGGSNGTNGGSSNGGSNGANGDSTNGSTASETPGEGGILDPTENGSDTQSGGRARTRIR